jgi:glucuronate isomerase
MLTPASSDSFLLRTETARQLYHEHAARLPIIDYHSHLDAGDLAADRQFRDLTHLWIEPDQYKHRAMRLLGVPEDGITGRATPREKFDRWAAALPQTLGNPLYHWSQRELGTYFGIDRNLDPTTADAIWEQANVQLRLPSHRARGLLAGAGVELVCTSDRWLDRLDAHRELADGSFGPRVLPSLRADEALAIDEPEFKAWVQQLGEATGEPIRDLATYRYALNTRLDHFADHGCMISDHGLDGFDYVADAEGEAARAFQHALAGTAPDAAAARAFRSTVLTWLGEAYGRRGWVMQLHLGAQRHTSSRLRQRVGRAGGYAAIGRTTDVAVLCRFLDQLEIRGALPKTILYPLNPADYAPFAALTGSFTEDGVPGKLQLGPAWWFNDHASGIRQHLEATSHIGLLSTFIGMTTDSRSLLSMSRHDYFRRILCDYLGEQVRAGAYPNDTTILSSFVRRIAYENARAWLPAPMMLPVSTS